MNNSIPEIVRRAEQAIKGITPGEWEAENMEAPHSDGSPGSAWGVVAGELVVILHDFVGELDAKFIAAAPQLVRDLVAAVTGLQLEHQETRGTVAAWKQIANTLADAIAPYRQTLEDRELWQREDGSMNVDALVAHARNARQVGERNNELEAEVARLREERDELIQLLNSSVDLFNQLGEQRQYERLAAEQRAAALEAAVTDIITGMRETIILAREYEGLIDWAYVHEWAQRLTALTPAGQATTHADTK